MKLRIPQVKSAMESFTEEDITRASTFAELGEATLYRGAVILPIQDTIAHKFYIYIFSVNINNDGDPFLSLKSNKLTTEVKDEAMIIGKQMVDDGIRNNIIIEQANEDIYIPDLEEEFIPRIKKELIHIAKKNTPTNSFTLDMMLLDMHSKGGKQLYTFPDGTFVAGYIVEIYQDNVAHKLRARTNDGKHGLANVAFPNDKRFADAVYILPSNMTYNGKNYIATANMQMYRIR